MPGKTDAELDAADLADLLKLGHHPFLLQAVQRFPAAPEWEDERAQAALTLIAYLRRTHRGDLYARYVKCLDDATYASWPAFFTEQCLYRIQARENHDRGLPLDATVHYRRAFNNAVASAFRP